MPDRSDPSEVLWQELLDLIVDGVVVPIVGREVLVVDTADGSSVPLYRHLAEVLATSLELPGPPARDPNPLNTLACAYLQQHHNLNDFYKAVRGVAVDAERLPLPRPLLQLAAITDFSLFVSTTFDRLLGRAINAVRFHETPGTEILRFSPYGSDDLPADRSARTHPTVFHLLGRISHVPEYALTEEDTLEFMHALQAENRRPARLFEELDQKVLLIIGNGLDDWLARFFIRTAKRERLWLAQRRVEFLADTSLRRGELGSFLQHFSTSTRLFDDDPVAFIASLHERWNAQKRSSPAVDTRQPFQPMPPGAVFISYAHEDATSADELARQLRSANLDVWLDRVDLKPGDAWEAKVLLNIQNASSFVPILSHHSLAPDPRFFRTEWDFAAQMQRGLPASARFIFPVVIDDTPRGHTDIPAALRDRQWTPFAELRPGHALLDAFTSNAQAFHLRRARP